MSASAGGSAVAERVFPIVGLALAVYAVAPPYLGPALHLARRVEIADHVIPAVVIVAASAVALLIGPSRTRGDTVFLAAALVVTLAGFWMTATHLPLIAQARRHQVPTLAALWHTSAGVAVLVFGGLWSARSLTSPSPDPTTD